MKFQTGGYMQQYYLNPNLRELVAAGSGVARRDIVGLSVSSNNTRIIDTDREAVTYGWKDDEKERMEKHLLSHPHFGTKVNRDSGMSRGDELLNVSVWKLWFADDQDIQEVKDRYPGFCEEQTWHKQWDILTLEAAPVFSSENMCLFSDLVGSSVMRCQEPALEGSDYCGNPEHMSASVAM